jgi:hypothetical protein
LTAAATVTELLEDVSRRGVTLWVEGGKLRFRAPKGALLEEHRAAFATRRSEVITALRAQAAGNVRFAPLSYNQRALWFVAQEAEASAAYNIAATARVRTKVDAGALRDALQGLTDRHAMLRTTYTLGDDGLPVQRTVGWVEVAFDVHDVRNIGDGELLERVSADYRRPIDLERGPVFRASLYARAPDDHVFLMVVHHIAADAWSMGVMVDDLQSLTSGTRIHRLRRLAGQDARGARRNGPRAILEHAPRAAAHAPGIARGQTEAAEEDISRSHTHDHRGTGPARRSPQDRA